MGHNPLPPVRSIPLLSITSITKLSRNTIICSQ